MHIFTILYDFQTICYDMDLKNFDKFFSTKIIQSDIAIAERSIFNSVYLRKAEIHALFSIQIIYSASHIQRLVTRLHDLGILGADSI